jgi:hypothetical protein
MVQIFHVPASTVRHGHFTRCQHSGINPVLVFHQGKGGILHIFIRLYPYGDTVQKGQL